MYKNHEGYKDITAAKAISRIKKEHTQNNKRSNLIFKRVLNYRIIKCMDEDIKLRYGLKMKSTR